MIPNKLRESRRVRAKLPRNLQRLYKQVKCRECAVVVTRMDFAKILGKFTKVKIQYESSSTPKTKLNSQNSPKTYARLKSNENGMVLLHRKSYNQHPAKEITSPKKMKAETPRTTNNILKENNRLKKSLLKDKNSNNNDYNEETKINNLDLKQYGIIFEEPLIVLNTNNTDVSSKISLTDLLSEISDNILPSEDWCIDFFPKKGEPKDDKVYDRIAAELEDLMYNEKPAKSNEKTGTVEAKVDDFPSIMDILNDNTSVNKTNDQSPCLEFKTNLESSDVEAMLLGKPNATSDAEPPTPMEVDNTNVSTLIENVLPVIPDSTLPESNSKIAIADIKYDEDNPQSPSILDEALQKGIEEHLPNNLEKSTEESIKPEEKPVDETQATIENEDSKIKQTGCLASVEGITHLVFKKTKNDTCVKTVTCPKNLKYDIEINGKSVEFLGAPKFISSLEDLQVLLQIVNESELDSLYVLH